MVDIEPFRGLRYDSSVAGSPLATSAPAYEDLEASDYAAHRTANPYTVLELLAPGRGGYAAAAETLQRWLRTDVLRAEERPVLYRYELHELRGGTPAVQRGLLASVRLEPLGQGVVPHEEVQPARVEARRRRLRAVPVDLSPVFALTADHVPALDAVLDRPPATRPVIAFTDEHGVDHRVWALADHGDQTQLADALHDVRILIADGHHRYAAAVAEGASHTLTYIVDPFRHGPRLRAIHRLVEQAPADLLARLDAVFVVQPVGGGIRALLATLDEVAGPGCGLCLPGGRCFLLTVGDHGAVKRALPAGHSTEWGRLDAAIAEHVVLPLLGGVPAAHRNDASAAGAELDDGAALLVLRPPDLRTVLSIALSGDVLPPKSTSFAPKPRTGLVLRLLSG